MSILQQEDEVKVFPCPTCSKIISSMDNACRYCGLAITSDSRSLLVKKQDDENREHHIGNHKNMVVMGVVLFLVGTGLLLKSILALFVGGGFVIWSPIITVVGLGQIIYGMNGIRKEKKGG